MLNETTLKNPILAIGVTQETTKLKKTENKIVEKYSHKIDKLAAEIWEESQRDDISGNFCNTLQEIARVLRNLNAND